MLSWKDKDFIEKVLKDLRADIEYVFTSPNELDRNLETANIVDALYTLARAMHALSESIDNAIKQK